MKRPLSENVTVQIFFLALVVLISRIPFLWAGFGSEEDAWLLPLTAKNIALSGMYQMSRAPGHPLQELLYALLYHNGLSAFTTNLISAIASVIATVFFALTLKNLGIKNYLFAAFGFAFTPIVFIASTYTIDYMLAMAFVMGGVCCLTPPLSSPPKGEKPERAFPPLGGGTGWGAILLGLAIGFRLTSVAMLVPFCILLSSQNKDGLKGIFIFLFTTLLIGTLCYIPVLKTYGLSFFTFSDQFPYPNLPKVFYKATLGVFGAIGLAAIVYFKINFLLKRFRDKMTLIPAEMPRTLFWASISAILIYLFSYLRLPQKSAYLIPMIPFVILLFAFYLSEKQFKIFCVLLTLSSFVFSINLSDPLRGSAHSALSAQCTVAGQQIFIDPLSGPVLADYTKRLNKIAYTEKVFQKTGKEEKKIVLICGWWYNELQVRYWGEKENQNVKLVFYIDKTTMEKYISEGYEIDYLSEQDQYNDQFSWMNYTHSVAKAYM